MSAGKVNVRSHRALCGSHRRLACSSETTTSRQLGGRRRLGVSVGWLGATGPGKTMPRQTPRVPASSLHPAVAAPGPLRAAHPTGPSQSRGNTGLSPFAMAGLPLSPPRTHRRRRRLVGHNPPPPGPASPRGLRASAPLSRPPGPVPPPPPVPLSVLPAGGGAAARRRPLPRRWAGSGAPRPANRPSGAAAAGARCRELGAEGGPEMGILSITDQVPPPRPPAPRRAPPGRAATRARGCAA